MQCKTKENISKEVVEYFDEMDQSSVMNHLVFHAKNVAEWWDHKNIKVYMEKLTNHNIKTMEEPNLYGFISSV